MVGVANLFQEDELVLEEGQADMFQWLCAVEEDQLALHEANGDDACKQMVAAERRRRAQATEVAMVAAKLMVAKAQLRQATEVAMTAAAAAGATAALARAQKNHYRPLQRPMSR